jgi:hypothetical protein
MLKVNVEASRVLYRRSSGMICDGLALYEVEWVALVVREACFMIRCSACSDLSCTRLYPGGRAGVQCATRERQHLILERANFAQLPSQALVEERLAEATSLAVVCDATFSVADFWRQRLLYR